MPDEDQDENEDEIIAEIRAARRKIAEECGYDFDKLVERYKRMQAENPENLVDKVPKSDEDLPRN
ncbi:MAG: hypothetical protein WCB27_14105 [Thermoguttaceae bacterium]|jgi:hypothetical protein